MNSIELKNITKRYGSFRAVDDLSFEIKQGDFVGFLGVNGAGKSTTVNMMSTILTPDEGEAYLCGYRLGKEDMEIRKNIGVVYQSNVLDDLFTVKENIVIRSKMLGLDDRTIKSRLAELSDILKLSDIMNKLIQLTLYIILFQSVQAYCSKTSAWKMCSAVNCDVIVILINVSRIRVLFYKLRGGMACYHKLIIKVLGVIVCSFPYEIV
ncbi:ABC transporter ATP-binding protein [Butyrivibrio proteoclasticus B316]|uniref:ABC transporter ATP-binding protein n=1 Tax=Butyrivibrio proteoclasticus (strain ATCC 51982 / DSM 14932 / B316) TaxID=515622 RepID=E0RY21_BUTPB|nr:ABC transporter ATP-binding protein [Butyrivibrio proteoclasticus B316]